MPHRFDLSEVIDSFLEDHPDADSVPLAIAFTDPPRNLGQVNLTSRIRDAKPRFYYGWDWTPRIVQIAISDRIGFEIEDGLRIGNPRLYMEFDSTTGEDTVDRLYSHGSEQTAGTWGGFTTNATHKTVLITGPGILNVANGVASPPTYETWAAQNNVIGGPGGVSDFDGITNLIEYALDLNPAESDGEP